MIRINESLFVYPDEHEIRIEFEKGNILHVSYGKDLDNLILALLYCNNSKNYNLPILADDIKAMGIE